MTTAATTQPAERSISLLDRELRFVEKGQGSPLLVLHHSTGNYGWLPFYEELSRSFRVIVPDMPGYGQSERPEWARDTRDIAIIIDCLIESLGLEGVSLVGLGFGGFVAAQLATMSPGRLKSLTLIGAAGLKPDADEILDQMMLDFVDYVRAGFRDERSFDALVGEAGAEEMKELWDYSREMTARLSWKPYMHDRRLPFLLRRVATPALIVWGSEDKVVPLECARKYAGALENSRLEVLPGAGHLVEMEEPEAVARMIVEHVGGLGS